MAIGTLTSRARRAPSGPTAALLLLGALCLSGLAGCQDDAPTTAATVAPIRRPRDATWRVVVAGASPQTDAQVLDAVDADLLQRGIASRIVTVEGQVDHVLDIEIGRAHRIGAAQTGAPGAKSRAGARSAAIRFFDTIETIREGRDSAFAIERTFETGAPGPDVAGDVAADPVRSLVFQVGEQLDRPSLPASPGR